MVDENASFRWKQSHTTAFIRDLRAINVLYVVYLERKTNALYAVWLETCIAWWDSWGLYWTFYIYIDKKFDVLVLHVVLTSSLPLEGHLMPLGKALSVCLC